MMGPWPLRRRRSVSPNTTVLATIFSSASPNTFHSTPSRARTWCDRRTGIGADGLIFGLPPGPNHDDEGDIVMRLFNSDGSPRRSQRQRRALLRSGGRSGAGWADLHLKVSTPAGVASARCTAPMSPTS